jgi:hypothetical protein
VPIATVASAKRSLLEQKEGPSSGRPCGIRGSHNGAHPEVTPSRVTHQRSADPALFRSQGVRSQRGVDPEIDSGVARGGWAASNSHTLPHRPRQTGLPGPTPFSSPSSPRLSERMQLRDSTGIILKPRARPQVRRSESTTTVRPIVEMV